MVIDLTYACSMGCTHCMSDCKPDGQHMSLQVLEDALVFSKKVRSPGIILSGGEIFEHPQIKECLNLCYEHYGKGVPYVLITNGRTLSSDIELLEFVKEFKEKVGKKYFMMQVTDDKRYYPTKLTDKQRYRLEKLGCIIEPVPSSPDDPERTLYPQGRALENFPDSKWQTNAPKCANARLIVKQGTTSISGIIHTLMSAGKTCTPTIAPDGGFKLGESRLCPAVGTIYDDESTIIENIRNMKCTSCKIPLQILKESNPLGYALLMS